VVGRVTANADHAASERGAGRTLSEQASLELVARYGVPVVTERSAATANEAVRAAETIGFPVAVKLHGDQIAHKTERGLVRLDVGRAEDVHAAAMELLDAATPDDGEVDLVVAPMVRGVRELIAGTLCDAQFGACVMVGVGGVLAEALGDVAFRVAPLTEHDAHDMLDELRTQTLFGRFRGEPAIDREAVTDLLLALSRLAIAESDVRSVDLNPVIISDGGPVAVDALVELW
jgi:succinyl-CoA synthetase beta subunit